MMSRDEKHRRENKLRRTRNGGHGAFKYMRVEDREDFVDVVAQAVIDKIEERDRLTDLVETVVAKVLAMQKADAELKAAADAEAKAAGTTDDSAATTAPLEPLAATE